MRLFRDMIWRTRAEGDEGGEPPAADAFDPEDGLDSLAETLSLESDSAVDTETFETADEPSGDEYEVLESGLVKWKDGTVADFDGNIVEERPEPEPAPKPAARQPQARAAAEAAPQVWTEEAVERSVFTDAIDEELADLAISDPMEYQRRSRALNREVSQKISGLHRHADYKFDTELVKAAADKPEVYKALAAEIQTAKAQLTVEQKQTEGMAEYMLDALAFQKLREDPLAFREAFMRVMGGKGGAPAARQAAPPKPAAPAPRKPNPAAQLSPPGSARKAAEPRRPTPAGAGGRDSMALHYQKLYSISYDEAKEIADNYRSMDAQKYQGGVTIHG